MDNQKILSLKEKLEKLAKLDTKYEIFGAAKHKYILNEKKTTEELQKFETQYGLTLPEEYKTFLIQMGNGGAGPYYGLEPLEKAVPQNDNDPKIFSQPFPISNEETKKFLEYHASCLEDGDDDEIKYFNTLDELPGAIYLSEYGCGWSYILVIKGEQTGKIWLIGDYLSPVFIGKAQWDFFDWYENWLDNSLKKIEVKEEKPIFDENTKIINYDGWKLKEIPKEVLKHKNIKKLVFSRNDLAEFPKEILQLTKLCTLDLSMTPITEIPPEICALKNLKKLRLNYNYHTTLPDTLDQLKSLEEFSMYYNYKITDIPEVIGRITSLKRIYLTYCGLLKKIPDNIGNLKNLEIFQINDCSSLETLPQSFGQLTNLKSLSIGKTKIKKLPDGFENLKNLETLAMDIEEFDLEDAVSKLKKLPKLTYLKISHQLEYPESFRELQSLKTLMITQNFTLRNQGHIKLPIPEQVALIPNLEILDLMNNHQAESLPVNIGNLSHLKELSILSTAIKKFPESLQKLTHFEKILAHIETKTDSPFGITLKEKEKLLIWFPKAKIWIY